MTALPVSFEHGYHETQLQWLWNQFEAQAPNLFNICVDNAEDAQALWDVFVFGAYCESQRGGQG